MDTSSSCYLPTELQQQVYRHVHEHVHQQKLRAVKIELLQLVNRADPKSSFIGWLKRTPRGEWDRNDLCYLLDWGDWGFRPDIPVYYCTLDEDTSYNYKNSLLQFDFDDIVIKSTALLPEVWHHCTLRKRVL